MDHVSHGKSDGERGLITNHRELYEDLTSFVNAYRKQHDELAVFVLAHSMGTLATIMSLNRMDRVTAVALSGPAIFAGPAASSPFGIRCLYPLSQTSFAACLTSCTSAVDPRGPAAPLDIQAVTSHPDEIDIILHDPRRNPPVVMNRTAKELLQLIQQVKLEIPRLTLPILVIHGAEDAIALPKSAHFIMQHVGTELAQRKLQIFAGCRHECFHEIPPHDAEAIACVADFFDSYLSDITQA
eukprot:gene35025-42414_t